MEAKSAAKASKGKSPVTPVRGQQRKSVESTGNKLSVASTSKTPKQRAPRGSAKGKISETGTKPASTLLLEAVKKIVSEPITALRKSADQVYQVKEISSYKPSPEDMVPDVPTGSDEKKPTLLIEEREVSFRFPTEVNLEGLDIENLEPSRGGKSQASENRVHKFSFAQRLQEWRIGRKMRVNGRRDMFFHHKMSGENLRSVLEVIEFIMYEVSPRGRRKTTKEGEDDDDEDDHDEPVEEPRINELTEACPINKPAEEYPISKSVEESHINEPTEEFPINKPAKEHPISKLVEEARINEPVEETRIKEPAEEYLVNEPEKEYHINELVEEYGIEESEKKYCLDELTEEYRINQPIEEYPINEPADEYCFNKPTYEYPINEPAEKYYFNQPMEEYHINEPTEGSRKRKEPCTDPIIIEDSPPTETLTSEDIDRMIDSAQNMETQVAANEDVLITEVPMCTGFSDLCEYIMPNQRRG
ncbi:hypothetical protein MLD38_018456 [Melastoma candidum]|uniref:Uncharacterized protein n=1 Tax=Melastoma candidum TaxID=119954 RepID=A0ACB9QX05_9MYRT|nr:hypothetical protein MLD38_018456 [Melastoma candidum]